MGKKKALFLDRDGVINVDHGYVSKIEDFEFIEGIFPLCRKAKELGYLIIVVTNQSGIGRGYYTEVDFHNLMNWVKQEFVRNGVEIDKVYYSPYHEVHGIGKYKQDSEDRKPKPGMILKARDELGIDLAKSILVGDKEKDIEAAIAAGIGSNALFTTDKSVDTKADRVISALREIEGLL